MNELIVFLMREFGWTLEYTIELLYGKEKAKKLVQKPLPLKKLNALIAETQYQKAMDDYSLKVALFNIVTNPHTKHPQSGRQLIGQPPSRGGKGETGLRKQAQDIGIIMPKGG